MATIRKRENKWQVQVRRTGATPLSRSFLNRKDADEWARHAEIQIDRRDLPANPKILERITFGALIERYRDEVSPKKLSRHNEVITLNAFLRDPICRKHLSELTHQDFAAYRDKRLSKVRPHTLKRELCPLQNLFEVARHEWGLPIRNNPVKGLRVDLVSNRRERRLMSEELERLLEASQKSRNQYTIPIIEFALETGLRRNNVTQLQWSQIDLSRCLAWIHPDQAKMRKAIGVPLSDEALDILKGQSGKHTTWVFPYRGMAVKQVATKAWRDAIIRAGIEPGFRWHDLRHTWASWHAQNGTPLHVLQELGGWASAEMVQRYAHLSMDHLAQWVNRREKSGSTT